METATQFTVDRSNLSAWRLIEKPLAPLADGSLLVRIERFALTANNITYALLGDELKYWHLFPADEGQGIIPVWGFGEVVTSRHSDVPEHELLFGYFPMATHLVIAASHVTDRGLRDGAAHRQGVSPVYNAYARVAHHRAFAGRLGDYQALLRPLFMLSFLVDDYLAEADFFGAKSVILSSASSKTAFGLAHLLHKRGVRTIGLTSAANTAFTASLGCYDTVVDYDALEQLPPEPVCFVDMAGNAKLRDRLHRHFGDALRYSGRVGLTHQGTAAESEPLPGPQPVWFFAPDQMRKRNRDWGPGEIDTRINTAWADFVPLLQRCLRVDYRCGPESVAQAYQEVLDGRTQPDEGLILSMEPKQQSRRTDRPAPFTSLSRCL